MNNLVGVRADRSSLRRLLPLLGAHRADSTRLVALASAGAASLLVLFYAVGRAVEGLDNASTSSLLRGPIGAVLLFGLTAAACKVGAAIIGARIASAITVDLQRQVFARRAAKTLPALSAEAGGPTTNAILHDVPLVGGFVVNALQATTTAVVSVASVLVVVSVADVRLLGFYVLLLLLVWPYNAVQRRMRSSAVSKIQAMGHLQSFLAERVGRSGTKFARTFGVEAQVDAMHHRQAIALADANAGVIRATGWSDGLSTLAHAAFLTVVTLVIAVSSFADLVDVGDLVVVILSTPLVVGAFQTHSMVGYWVATAAAVVEAFGLEPDAGATAPTVLADGGQGDSDQQGLRAREVSFRYAPSDGVANATTVLDGVNLRIGAGEFVAIVGEVGCGKSTLAMILAGLITPDRGRVTGPREGLVCLVDNDELIFQTTIADNLRMVDPSVTTQRMVEVCRDIGIHDHISGLPRGYQTVVGERGARLSSGQRQLLAIARAVVARPAVLILDEATTCLDSESEHHVVRALRGLQPAAIVLIAHRMSSVMLADRVLILQQGRVAASGNHDDLLDRSAPYRRFCTLQGIR